MTRFIKWATACVALTVMSALMGCGTVSNATAPENTPPNPNMSATNNTVTQNMNTTSTHNTAVTNATNKASNAPVSNLTAASTSATQVTLENIQYASNALVLTMTHGNMQATYAEPHFTTGLTKQFVVTLRNTNPGQYPLNQVQSANSNWAKNMVMTKSGNDLILTFNLKQAFQSFQSGIAGGFEIQFSFK